MANRTAGQVLSQVDALLPNQYTLEEKRRWLQQAEGFVCEEILHETLGETFSDETELRVPPPYDELYRFYLEAQIHYANGETARYNSAAGLWNNAFLTYRDYRARTAAPEGGARALRLC